MKNKFRGIVLASAIGDAIGKSFEDLDIYEVESFYNTLPIDDYVEPHPSSPACFQKANETSDETTIVRLLLESIVESKKLDVYSFFEKLKNWALDEASHRYPDPFTLKAVYSILSGSKDNLNFSSVEGILRVIATSMLHYKDEELAKEASKLVVGITHRADVVFDGAVIFNNILLKAINNDESLLSIEGKMELLENLKSDVSSKHTKDMLNMLQNALEEGFSKDKAIIMIGSGNFVLESLGLSIYYFLSEGTEYPYETLIKAINSYWEFGADTDSIGFITGSLIGAYHGYEFLPQHLIDNLENSEYYIKLADSLHSISNH